MSDRETAPDAPADGGAADPSASSAGDDPSEGDVRDDPDGAGAYAGNGTGETAAPEEEWAYTVEDIEERERRRAEEAAAAESEAQPLEAGDPSLEGVAFVIVGVLFTLFVLSRLVVG